MPALCWEQNEPVKRCIRVSFTFKTALEKAKMASNIDRFARFMKRFVVVFFFVCKTETKEREKIAFIGCVLESRPT